MQTEKNTLLINIYKSVSILIKTYGNILENLLIFFVFWWVHVMNYDFFFFFFLHENKILDLYPSDNL